ncbi:uncharacterized protein [Drosophila kikkawai]|uniref:Uncharacterized protein n=1 Tax=Drosophila kikkawai TaxID=30033 RepID=A0ABM4GQD7_DROKI
MSWLADNGLSLAEQKTEAVLISSRKVVEKAQLQEYAAAKASKATAAISRMMANTRGPRQHSRRLISTVVTSTLLYAAPIWSEAMLVANYSRQCRTVYRRCALRISSCFCPVSEEAALVVADRSLSTCWQRNAGPVTRAAEPRGASLSQGGRRGGITRALDAGHIGYPRSGSVDTQTSRASRLLHNAADHGPRMLQGYLHRFKHEADPSCDYCGGASVEDAEHAFFECPLFARKERQQRQQPTVAQ